MGDPQNYDFEYQVMVMPAGWCTSVPLWGNIWECTVPEKWSFVDGYRNYMDDDDDDDDDADDDAAADDDDDRDSAIKHMGR